VSPGCAKVNKSYPLKSLRDNRPFRASTYLGFFPQQLGTDGRLETWERLLGVLQCNVMKTVCARFAVEPRKSGGMCVSEGHACRARRNGMDDPTLRTGPEGHACRAR